MTGYVFIDQNDKTGQFRIGIETVFGEDIRYYYADTRIEAENIAKGLQARIEQKQKNRDNKIAAEGDPATILSKDIVLD